MNDTLKLAGSTPVVERLAQKLQDSDLGDLLDEDAVTALARTAIEKAFFEQRLTGNSYNSSYKDPLAVELATAAFKDAIQKAAEPLVKEIVQSEQFSAMLVDTVLRLLPQASLDIGHNIVSTAMRQSAIQGMDDLSYSMSDKIKQIRDSGMLNP